MNTGQRFISIVSIVTLFVVGCGGGGGGASNPPSAPAQGGVTPTPAPVAITGSIVSVADTAIALGAPAGESTIAWTSNATLPNEVSVRVNGVVVSGQPTSPQGGQKVAVSGAGDVKVELMNASGQVLDTKTARVSCALGQWQNGLCDKFRFDRLDLVLESLPINPGDMPFSVLRDGKATRLTNRTGYEVQPGAGIPLGNCYLYSLLREDNAPLVACNTIATGNQLRVFPINPLTGELMPEYTGPIPSGAVEILGLYGTFGDSPFASYGVGQSGMYIDVPGYGIYYVTNVDTRQVYLTRDMFQTRTLVMESQGVRVLYSFSGK